MQNLFCLILTHEGVELICLHDVLDLTGLLVQVGNVFLQLFAPLVLLVLFILERPVDEFFDSDSVGVGGLPVSVVNLDVLVAGKIPEHLYVDIGVEEFCPFFLDLLEEGVKCTEVAHVLTLFGQFVFGVL